MVNPIESLFFGTAQRSLFGTFQRPTQGAQRAGVVLCNAFGQEAIRAHRMMRVLAERLVRQGHPVLRFDYFGSGDAMGDDADADLEGWTTDLLTADSQLRELAGVDQTIWLGMRLGASVALKASRQAPSGLKCLILWDPVIDGKRYLAHLRERHVAVLESAFSVKQRPSPSQIALNPANYLDEAIGAAVSPAMRQQLITMSLRGAFSQSGGVPIIAVVEPESQDARDLDEALKACPGRARVLPVQHGTDWTSAAAENSALVPAQALMTLVKLTGEVA